MCYFKKIKIYFTVIPFKLAPSFPIPEPVLPKETFAFRANGEEIRSSVFIFAFPENNYMYYFI